jgi:pyruvyltransferase
VNFGDYLSRVVVHAMLKRRNLAFREWQPQGAKLLAIGSVLHYAGDLDVIWGSGFNGKIAETELKFASLNVRAVRGKLTREVLTRRGIEVPEVFGDPALLLPHLLGEQFPKWPRRGTVFVPNLHDLAIDRQGLECISPILPWYECVGRIVSADFVIASSLHGIIVAEAFGVPCRYVRLSPTESLFKYNDYRSGTGRGDVEFATSLAEAIEMGPAADRLVYDPAPLMEAFPYDLFR